LRLSEQGLPNVLAEQELFQRCTVKYLLRPVGFDRRGAMELQRSSGAIQQQVTAEQAMLGVFDHGQETQRRPINGRDADSHYSLQFTRYSHFAQSI
jgi:hypothetical protein